MTPERRAMLAGKGRTLYGKFCGTGGRGICAESFACYHLGRGEAEVVADLIAHLEARITRLTQSDPDARLPMTRGLLERLIRRLEGPLPWPPRGGPGKAA